MSVSVAGGEGGRGRGERLRGCEACHACPCHGSQSWLLRGSRHQHQAASSQVASASMWALSGFPIRLAWPSLAILGSWGADLALAGSENKLRRDSHPSPISLALAPPLQAPPSRPVCGFPQPTQQPDSSQKAETFPPIFRHGVALAPSPWRGNLKLESSMPGRSSLTARRAVFFPAAGSVYSTECRRQRRIQIRRTGPPPGAFRCSTCMFCT